jgi:large subunit ribosomal protein L24
MRKIRKGDEVIVTAGKDKGRRGQVIRVLQDEDKIVVQNVNVAKRHTKANPQRGIAGGIVEKEMPLSISNVALYNAATGKADRVGIRVLEDGRKVRFFKSNNEVIDA